MKHHSRGGREAGVAGGRGWNSARAQPVVCFHSLRTGLSASLHTLALFPQMHGTSWKHGRPAVSDLQVPMPHLSKSIHRNNSASLSSTWKLSGKNVQLSSWILLDHRTNRESEWWKAEDYKKPTLG